LSFIEGRRAQRFELQLPVIVRWSDGDEMREALAVSGDVSSNGIYFVLRESLKEGTPVELEMTLPDQITLAGPVRVSCFGHIQRCELKEGANAGMAAAIEKYRFLRDTGKAPSKESSSLNSEG
jgi:hypothetical protein